MKTIGKYRITGALGRGGMGRVYKVVHPEIPRILAMKAFRPHPFLLSSVGKKRLLDMFRNEAAKMALLVHPNIAAAEDLSFEPVPYYTMTYHPRSLGMLMGEQGDMEKCRRLDPDSALHFLAQLLDALHCLHFHGMIHRDVKPWNLLLNDAETLILGDFGLSRLRHEITGTPANIKVGSPGYAAPEQLEHPDLADERADIYSAAVVFYRMLTGSFPENGNMEKCLPEPAPLWMDFLSPALSPRPAERYQKIPEMRHYLDRLRATWQDFKDRECYFFTPGPETDSEKMQAPILLRSRPCRTGVRGGITDLLEATPFFGPARTFRGALRHGASASVILDETTGLVWEQAGSPFPVARSAAENWIHQRNEQALGGRRNWRLPTVPELFSLTREWSDRASYCEISPFDPRQSWVWSADTRSFVTAWFVDLLRNFASPMDLDGRCFVRAVSGP